MQLTIEAPDHEIELISRAVTDDGSPKKLCVGVNVIKRGIVRIVFERDTIGDMSEPHLHQRIAIPVSTTVVEYPRLHLDYVFATGEKPVDELVCLEEEMTPTQKQKLITEIIDTIDSEDPYFYRTEIL